MLRKLWHICAKHYGEWERVEWKAEDGRVIEIDFKRECDICGAIDIHNIKMSNPRQE